MTAACARTHETDEAAADARADGIELASAYQFDAHAAYERRAHERAAAEAEAACDERAAAAWHAAADRDVAATAACFDGPEQQCRDSHTSRAQ